MSATQPKIIGGFEIIQEVGRGAMGVVFKARQISMDRIVALKFLPKSMAQDTARVQRFVREARLSGKLTHPNIVAVHDVGQVDGLYYIAMEFVDGTTVHRHIKEKGPFSEAEAIELGLQIAAALKEAHTHNILHRDIKPDNFLLDKSNHIHLADLGLARFQNDDKEGHLTQSGTAVGTPHYMAPEQARGEDVDARADLYGVGSSLYTMTTGKTVFEGPTAAVILVKVISEEPKSPREFAPDLSDGFVSVMMKLMAKDPAKRFQSAQELIEALEAVRDGSYHGELTIDSATGRSRNIRNLPSRGTESRPRMGTSKVDSAGGLSPAVMGGIAAAVLLLGFLIFAVMGKSSSNTTTNSNKTTTQAQASTGTGTNPTEPDPAMVPATANAEEQADAKKKLQALKLYTELAGQQQKSLLNRPSQQAEQWEYFLKQFPQSAHIADAKRQLEAAKLASDALKSEWSKLKNDTELLSAKGDYFATLKPLHAFELAHQGSTQSDDARDMIDDMNGKIATKAKALISEANAAAEGKEYDKARGILDDLKQKLPPDLFAQFDGPDALANINKLERAGKAKELEAERADFDALTEAQEKAKPLVLGPDGYYQIGKAGQAFQRVSGQMRTPKGKIMAVVFTNIYTRVNGYWTRVRDAVVAAPAAKKPQIASLGALKFPVTVNAWDDTTLKYAAASLPGEQNMSWKSVTPANVLELARSVKVPANNSPEELDQALLALIMGQYSEAEKQLKIAAALVAENSDDTRLVAGLQGWLRDQSLKNLEEAAKGVLSDAKADLTKKDYESARKNLAAFAEGGLLCNTAVARDNASDIEALNAAVSAAVGTPVTETTKTVEASKNTDDASDAFKKLGWKVTSGKITQPDPKKPTQFHAKDVALRMDVTDGALLMNFTLKPEASVAIYFRKWNGEELLRTVDLPDPIKQFLGNNLTRVFGDGYAAGYGIEISNTKADALGAGEADVPRNRNQPKPIQLMLAKLPGVGKTWDITGPTHKVTVQLKDHLQVDLDNQAPYTNNRQMITDGPLIVKFNGDVDLEMPKFAR